MKIKEMQKICHDQKGNCEKCKLNVNVKWYEKMESWCLIRIKQNYIKAYKQYKAEGNDLMAEMTMKRYKDLESKYL